MPITMAELPKEPQGWFYSVVEMAYTPEGLGPAKIGEDEVAEVRYEIWDSFCEIHDSGPLLNPMIARAIELNLERCVLHPKGFLYDPDICGVIEDD